MISLTSEQKKILKILLAKYESSKTCFGENKVNQSFNCKPNDIYYEYYSDYVDIDEKKRYDLEINELENAGYLSVKRRNGDIELISMINEKYLDYCQILGAIPKADSISIQKSVFERYSDNCELLKRICEDQIERLNFKKDNSISKDVSEIEKIFECILAIINNEHEILERELSISVFSDSKVFENKYKSKVCNLLLKYEPLIAYNNENDKKVLADMILSEYGIVKNPTYIFFKGHGVLRYKSGYSLEFVPEVPIAVNSNSLKDIDSVSVSDKCIMTVENLTSYNRLNSDNTFLVYISGYSNKAKISLLKLIHHFNTEKTWYHFGDIDPDGFHILENLISKTEIAFRPFCMSIAELIEYKKFTKELEKNDIQKTESLLQSNYADTVKYMLDNNCKLEQEIISWKNSRIVL